MSAGPSRGTQARRELGSCARALRLVSDSATAATARAGLSAAFVAQLDATVAAVPNAPQLLQLVADYDAVLHDDLLPALADVGLLIVDWAALNRFERVRVQQIFEKHIHPLLTPMTVDATHPFPQVPDLSLNLAVRIREPLRGSSRFVCVTLPRQAPRCIVARSGRLVTVESVVSALLPTVLVGVQVVECSCFRVTRSSAAAQSAAPNVSARTMADPRRRGAPAVRLEVETRTSDSVVALLAAQLGVPTSGIHRERSSLAMGAALSALTGADNAAAPARVRSAPRMAALRSPARSESQS